MKISVFCLLIGGRKNGAITIGGESSEVKERILISLETEGRDLIFKGHRITQRNDSKLVGEKLEL